MRKSRAGLALVVTGCILLLLAPAWRLGIAPLFLRLPDDLEVIGAYTGKMTLFAERETSKFYPPGQEVTTPIRIDSMDTSVPSLSNRRVLVMKERVLVSDAATGEALEGLRPETMYVLDRRTCRNIPGIIEGIERRGYTVKLPMGARKKVYAMWDDDLEASIPCRFVKEARLDGGRVKGLKVYVYRVGGSIEKMAKPPPGLPESITGKAAKAATGNPGLPIADDREIKLEYFKRTDATLFVEPTVGTTLYVPRHRYQYFMKNPPGRSPTYQKLAEVEYAKDRASTIEDIDSSTKYIRLINLDKKGVPFFFLLMGLALLGTGLLLNRRAAKLNRRQPPSS